MSSGFREVYTALAAAVTADAVEAGLEPARLRHPDVAEASLVAVPRATLLGLESDEDFVVNAYLVLLDRQPWDKELAWRLRRLRNGRATREELLEEMVHGVALARDGLTVTFT